MIFTEDLGKQFGDFWAVEGVNLEAHPGNILALLGQNGAGKTTTIRLLTSILRPSRGRATIAGYDVSQAPEKVRSVVGVLTEQHGLYLRMTGDEYLLFFGKVYGLETVYLKKRSSEILEYFGLGDVAKKRIGEYSKGMRQKLALARTLLHTPPILLLDEPTSAMDPESTQLVRTAIAGLRSDNRTTIICTHNLLEAELLADHVAIIYRGRILESGSVDELKNKLLGPPLFEVTTRTDWSDDRLELPPGVILVSSYQKGAFFSIPDPLNSNPRLLKNLCSRGTDVVTIREVPRTLEDVYLKAMSRVVVS